MTTFNGQYSTSLPLNYVGIPTARNLKLLARHKTAQMMLENETEGTRGQRSTGRTVSQIWSLMGLLSMVIMRAPNSTPMVRSCTGWKRLSVNCSSRHDFPTPAKHKQPTRPVKSPPRVSTGTGGQRGTRAADPPAARIPPNLPRARTARGSEEQRGVRERERRARRTCVADDDVLEEVGVRHPRSIGSVGPGGGDASGAPGLRREEKRRRVPEDSIRFAPAALGTLAGGAGL